MGAPGRRYADRDRALGGQACEEQCQRGMQHREQRRSPGMGDMVSSAAWVSSSTAKLSQPAAYVHRWGRARSAGSVSSPGNPASSALPEVDLTSREAAGISVVAEKVVPPETVVRVLHRQRCPPRCCAGSTGRVRGQQVAGEDCQRPPVRGDVVDHAREQVLLGPGGEQCGPQRRFAANVEATVQQPTDMLREFGCGDVYRGEVGDGVGGVEDPLGGAVGRIGIHRAQRVMPVEHVGGGMAQRLEVEVAADRDGEREVVQGWAGGGAVEELLRWGQWDPLGQRLCCERVQRGQFTGLRVFLGEKLGEGGDGGELEQIAHPQLGAEIGVECRDHPGGGERIPTEVEEGRFRVHDVGAQYPGEHPSHRVFVGCAQRSRRSGGGAEIRASVKRPGRASSSASAGRRPRR